MPLLTSTIGARGVLAGALHAAPGCGLIMPSRDLARAEPATLAKAAKPL